MARGAPKTPLWSCPECGAKLASRNLAHSCGDWSVERFLEGKSEAARALFARFEELVARCGPYERAPAKTRVAFMARIRFAAVNGVGERGLRAHVCLPRRIDSPRFSRVEPIGKVFVHHFRVARPEELDDEVLRWLRESYAFGS
ncbi:MAG TPA: DUF5655 domain-containing protein [Sandaracinaceae bacterium]